MSAPRATADGSGRATPLVRAFPLSKSRTPRGGGNCNEDLVEASEPRGCDRERSGAVPKRSWGSSIRSRAKGGADGEERARSQTGTTLFSSRASYLGTNQARGRAGYCD